MTRRPLGEMLAELSLDVLPAVGQRAGLHVRRVAIELPVEIGLKRGRHGTQLIGDMPRLLTRTAFDIRPSRMVVVWEAEP